MLRNRRELMGALAASGAVLASVNSARTNPVPLDLRGLKKETDIACLYHCDFGDPQRFSQMLQNMLNHYSTYDFDSFRLKLVVVAHGAGIKFFLEDLSGTPWEKNQSTPKYINGSPGSRNTERKVICARSPTSASKSIQVKPARMPSSNSCLPGWQLLQSFRPRGSDTSKSDDKSAPRGGCAQRNNRP